MTDHARTSYRNHRRATWGLVIAVVVAVAAVLVPLAAGAGGGGRPTTYAFTGNASACADHSRHVQRDPHEHLGFVAEPGSADLYAPTNLSVTDANILSGWGVSFRPKADRYLLAERRDTIA